MSFITSLLESYYNEDAQTGRYNQQCGRGWVGVKGNCKRSKKGLGESDRKAQLLQSIREKAKDDKAKKLGVERIGAMRSKTQGEAAQRRAKLAEVQQRGGALVPVGGRLAKFEGQARSKGQSTGKTRSAKREGGSTDRQQKIDEKYSSKQPTPKAVEGWMKDTALHRSKPTPANIKREMADSLGRSVGDMKDAKTFAESVYAKECAKVNAKPKAERITALKKQYEQYYRLYEEQAKATHEKVKSGDKAAIKSFAHEAIRESFSTQDKIRASEHPEKDRFFREAIMRRLSESAGESEYFKGLPKKPTAQELTAAYRKAAMKTHPDRGGNADEFAKVQEAYEKLRARFGFNRGDSLDLDLWLARLSR